MDLISKRDALDKVHKTIENLILRLPTVRGVDGEDYCTDPASLAAYNMAYDHIRREIQGIQPWNTEDPEVVRCAECKYWDRSVLEHQANDFREWDEAECGMLAERDPYHETDHYTEEDDFCSRGERKDG